MNTILLIIMVYILLGIAFTALNFYDFLMKEWSFDLGGVWLSNWVAYPASIVLWVFFVPSWYKRNVRKIY